MKPDKMMLIIDKPETCGDCILHAWADVEDWESLYVTCNGKKADIHDGLAKVYEIPSWCPLRPLPEKKEPFYDINIQEYDKRIDGWNDCLDELLNGVNGSKTE